MSESILTNDQLAEIEARDWHLNGALEKRIALSPAERDALVATVRQLRQQLDEWEQQRPGIIEAVQTAEAEVERLQSENERLIQANADLTAANISTLLTEIKERLTPEEAQQFEKLLMSATRDWVDEITTPKTKTKRRESLQ